MNFLIILLLHSVENRKISLSYMDKYCFVCHYHFISRHISPFSALCVFTCVCVCCFCCRHTHTRTHTWSVRFTCNPAILSPAAQRPLTSAQCPIVPSATGDIHSRPLFISADCLVPRSEDCSLCAQITSSLANAPLLCLSGTKPASPTETSVCKPLV